MYLSVVAQKSIISDQKKFYLCSKCGLRLSSKFNCERHKFKCSTSPREKKTEVTVCQNCRKSFSNYRSPLNHEKKCLNKSEKSQPFKCQTCHTGFDSACALVEHETRQNHAIAGSRKSAKCRKFDQTFYSFKDLYNHRIEMHQQSDHVLQTLQSDPWTANQTLPPWTDNAMGDSAEIKRIYHQQAVINVLFLEETTIKIVLPPF